MQHPKKVPTDSTHRHSIIKSERDKRNKKNQKQQKENVNPHLINFSKFVTQINNQNGGSMASVSASINIDAVRAELRGGFYVFISTSYNELSRD